MGTPILVTDSFRLVFEARTKSKNPTLGEKPMKHTALKLASIVLFAVQSLPAAAQQTSNPFRSSETGSATSQLRVDSGLRRSIGNPFRTPHPGQHSTSDTLEIRGHYGGIEIGGYAGRIVDSPSFDLAPPRTITSSPADQPYFSQQSADQWQNKNRPNYDLGHANRYSNARTPPQAQTSSQQPSYQQTIGQTGSSKRHDGVDYDANAGIGFDQRSDKWVGGRYDSQDGGIIGGGGSVGAGLYGDAGVSQSGKIGSVDVRNYAEGEAFVGTEASAKAGLTKNGVELGANGFAGGRASGTVGSEIGAVGYGATGEAWSGVGLEAGVNGGFKDGKLKFGAEAGAALGVGGKLGFQAEIDVEEIGNGVKKAGREVGNTAKKVGQNVGSTAAKVGKNVGQTTKKVTTNVGNTAKKAGKGIGDTARKVGGSTKKFFNKLKKKKK